MNDPDERARKAYEAYEESLGISRRASRPSWDELPDRDRQAWRAAIALPAVLASGQHVTGLDAAGAARLRAWLAAPDGVLDLGRVAFEAAESGRVLVRTRPWGPQ
jgi:hypothetical protein